MSKLTTLKVNSSTKCFEISDMLTSLKRFTMNVTQGSSQICPHTFCQEVTFCPWLQMHRHFLQAFCTVGKWPICLFSGYWNRPSLALKVLTVYFCEPCIKNQLWATLSPNLWRKSGLQVKHHSNNNCCCCKLAFSSRTARLLSNGHLLVRILVKCGEAVLHITFLSGCKPGPINQAPSPLSLHTLYLIMKGHAII